MDFLDEHVRCGRLAGALSLVVLRDGDVDVRGHGFRDHCMHDPITASTVFRLHSMSKAITSAAVLVATAAARIDLDTPASEFVPELARLRPIDEANDQRAVPITLRHLLTHTSGLAYPNARGTAAERSVAAAVGERLDFPAVGALDAWTRALGDAGLAHPPGEGFTYGVGIDVLGRVLEVLRGTTLDVALRDLILDPLGMHDTGFVPTPSMRQRLADIHRADPALGLVPLDASDEPPLLLSGGGGLFASGADLARFCRMFLDDGCVADTRILSPGALDAITRCQLGPLASREDVRGSRHLGPGMSFGLLGRVVVDPARSGYGARGTFGWDGVCGNTFFVDRASGVAGVLLTQILPWPSRLHEEFRASAYRRAAASR